MLTIGACGARGVVRCLFHVVARRELVRVGARILHRLVRARPGRAGARARAVRVAGTRGVVRSLRAVNAGGEALGLWALRPLGRARRLAARVLALSEHTWAVLVPVSLRGRSHLVAIGGVADRMGISPLAPAPC